MKKPIIELKLHKEFKKYMKYRNINNENYTKYLHDIANGFDNVFIKEDMCNKEEFDKCIEYSAPFNPHDNKSE